MYKILFCNSQIAVGVFLRVFFLSVVLFIFILFIAIVLRMGFSNDLLFFGIECYLSGQGFLLLVRVALFVLQYCGME